MLRIHENNTDDDSLFFQRVYVIYVCFKSTSERDRPPRDDYCRDDVRRRALKNRSNIEKTLNDSHDDPRSSSDDSRYPQNKKNTNNSTRVT
jgi:hypothetical protein